MPAYLAMGGAVVLLCGLAYTCSTKHVSDRLSDQQAEVTASAPEKTAANVQQSAPDPGRRCASAHSYDLVKRELFHRAALIRGRDDALFDRIASAAALRIERPLVTSRDEGLGSIACSADAAIDLPPGVTVAGGRTSLGASIGYTLQPTADDGGDAVALTNADAITVPLATIGRGAGAPAGGMTAPVPIPAPADPLAPRNAPPLPPSPPVVARPVSVAPPPVANRAAVARPPAPPGATPSFPCARARTRGEIIVCSDPGLAQLDRRMAAQYRSAYAAADPDRRDVLRSSAHRFYGFRDNCPDARCVANGYGGRMREIDDIMRGGDSDQER